MTIETITNPNLYRHRKACDWLIDEEIRVLQHALENYIKLGPDNSFPIKLARQMLKDFS